MPVFRSGNKTGRSEYHLMKVAECGTKGGIALSSPDGKTCNPIDDPMALEMGDAICWVADKPLWHFSE